MHIFAGPPAPVSVLYIVSVPCVVLPEYSGKPVLLSVSLIQASGIRVYLNPAGCISCIMLACLAWLPMLLDV